MFYVYDLDGLRFKGPMEALERQRRVDRRAPVTPLREGEEPFPFATRQGNEAIAAYRQATMKENMVEPLVHIYQIMNSPAATVHGDAPLFDAWLQLTREAIRQLVVVSDREEVVGLLSDRDILRRINVVGEEVEMDRTLTVEEVMQKETISTDSMSDIRRVAKVMAYYHVDAMPVIREGGQLVGVVTRGDILRGFAENPRLNLWG